RAGVTILYGCQCAGVERENDRISSLTVESVSGRHGITARMVVDATGDACVAQLAGAPTAVYRPGNILAAWYYGLGDKGYVLNTLGCSDVPP
ncbi:MAG TPA: hypothetical protein DDY87_04700, partial [Clostridiales bacterium]|nr:hypothetical protein [Clostridiales bacterium]